MELGLHSSACIFHAGTLCYLYKQSFLLTNCYVSHTILFLLFFSHSPGFQSSGQAHKLVGGLTWEACINLLKPTGYVMHQQV